MPGAGAVSDDLIIIFSFVGGMLFAYLCMEFVFWVERKWR